ncbi:hypothetical protein PR202_ga14223 [Eleusine coracana subsp. coracana]|uniref:Uncharacterized protein n=1 Tax=Eleusine coracana subsp. coracana TaxID=191504 RepID=A0AAV5CGL3_ELECO|nr:hypothetical protein PR202_ga14223 [Eleusine coracana subsp. coracana]
MSMIRISRHDDMVMTSKPDQLPAFKSQYMQLYAQHIKAALADLKCIPMVLWPLYAEQHLNAFQAVSDMAVVTSQVNNVPEEEAFTYAWAPS